MCFPGLRQGLWVTARGHELVPWKDSLKPGGPAYFGALMALTKLVGAPQCERGENQHLSNCGATWGQEQFPGGICLPACLWLSADPTRGQARHCPLPSSPCTSLLPSPPCLPPPNLAHPKPRLDTQSCSSGLSSGLPRQSGGEKAGEGRSRATGRSGARRGACRVRPMRARRSRAGGRGVRVGLGGGELPWEGSCPRAP